METETIGAIAMLILCIALGIFLYKIRDVSEDFENNISKPTDLIQYKKVSWNWGDGNGQAFSFDK